MKKLISAMIALFMVLSVAASITIFPASAEDGIWTVYTSNAEYEPDENGNPVAPTVWGYEYTDEGLSTIATDWSDRSAFGTLQTKEPVNIENGIYMQVRIDKFDYTANDMWIDFSFWDRENLSPGSKGFGEGVQTLIRPQTDEETGKTYFAPINWYTGEFKKADKSTAEEKLYVNEDGTVIFEIELKKTDDGYSLTINGCEWTNKARKYFNEKFAGGEAYVGISLYNTKEGSEVGCTILKFGTSKDTATVPKGDDRAEPVNNNAPEKAPIADPSTVGKGMPAIILTSDTEKSDLLTAGGDYDDEISVSDSGCIAIRSQNDTASVNLTVKHSVSYDIDDFPVFLVLTTNFCACGTQECYAAEVAHANLMTGDSISPDNTNRITDLGICWEPIPAGEGEEKTDYLYFVYDPDAADAPFDASGRINSLKLDFVGVTPEDTVHIVFAAFFRNLEDAEKYVMSYLGLADENTTETTENITEDTTEDTTEEPTNTEPPTTEVPGGDTTEVPGGDTTEVPGGDTTEVPGGDTTEVPGGDTTEAPKGEDKTEAPKGEDKTEAPKGDDKTTGDKPADKGGCGGVIGAGAFAVVVLVAAGAVVLRKKEEG